MKSLTVFSLAIFAVSLLIYMGINGIQTHANGGAFFVFLGACTAIGLAIDIAIHIRDLIRRNNIRKLS